MVRLISKRSTKTGLPPGTLVHVGERRLERARIRILDYDTERFLEKEVAAIEEILPFKESPTVTWVNIDGIHQGEIIEKIGAHFDIHPLVMEDIMSTGQRPKMEDFETYLFIVLKMIYRDPATDETEVEQLSLLLGENFVISFQERPGDVFAPVRERIRKAKGRIRRAGPDYLAYALIDAVVDNYFVLFESIGEHIEELEEELIDSPTPTTLQAIHSLKRDMIFIRRSIWPLREVAASLQRLDSPLITEATAVYLGDVHDHTVQIIDTVETFRDMISGMLDTYLSSLSNRMNEVMKVLTIIATIFIPLSFIAGVYGMNFDHMPELHWRWAYPWPFWGSMLGIAGVMLYFFRRNNWL